MGFLVRIVIALIGNIVGLLAAGYWVAGFSVTREPKELLIIAAILMVLNAVVRPILKLFLGPIIILTLGLGAILVSAIILLLLDFLFTGLTIATIPALLWSALIIGIANVVVHFAKRS